MDLKSIEQLEYKWLDKIHSLLYAQTDEIIKGFNSKKAILDDWAGKYGEHENNKEAQNSMFDKGAERVVYTILNMQLFSNVNSAPVGADLFYEMEDCFVHIDLKTVGASNKPEKKSNIGDFTDIFIGENQNSYKGEIAVFKGKKNESFRPYTPNLPTYYGKGSKNEKICLSFFVNVLHDKNTFDTLIISILSFPNGELVNHYGDRPLKPGKNKAKGSKTAKARARVSNVNKFELLDETPSRVKLIYFKDDMDEKYKNKLKLYSELYKTNKLN
tara:strand:+ start:783 stop:1598 length:816 start_codon:yes stop_codon:yes gene_type:complete